MLTGIRLKSYPNTFQKAILSQWMGCARYIWNAKCNHDKQQRQELNGKNIFFKIDQTYTQYKTKEETPWLFDCPSVILRNSVSNWRSTYQNFFKKLCGRPKFKKKSGEGSIHLTRELFTFIKGEDGVTRLFIGSKKNNIGYLSIKNHKKYKPPSSIYIKKKHNNYWVSFCYEAVNLPKENVSSKKQLKELKKRGRLYLEHHTIGIDRGIARPVQCSDSSTFFDLTEVEKKNKVNKEKQIRRYQKKLSRQKKGSNRRYRTKIRLSQTHSRISNIRKNFCHQTSKKLVDKETTKIIVFENLGTKRMTRRPKSKQDKNGKWLRNSAKSKSGLNKSILDKNWHQLEVFTRYKAQKAGKIFFKVSPHHTSQECAHCHHIHPNNRKSQAKFLCISCGHTDNADVNAAKVIKNRAIELILNSGTELSKRGVLSLIDSGRGDKIRRKGSSERLCTVSEASKKKVSEDIGSSIALA